MNLFQTYCLLRNSIYMNVFWQKKCDTVLIQINIAEAESKIYVMFCVMSCFYVYIIMDFYGIMAKYFSNL